MTLPNGAHPAHDEPMDPAEVLRRSEAFDPTPNRAAIMRLALQMIMRQSVNCLITPENKAAYSAMSDYGKGRLQGLYELRRIAEQALKECA